MLFRSYEEQAVIDPNQTEILTNTYSWSPKVGTHTIRFQANATGTSVFPSTIYPGIDEVDKTNNDASIVVNVVLDQTGFKYYMSIVSTSTGKISGIAGVDLAPGIVRREFSDFIPVSFHSGVINNSEINSGVASNFKWYVDDIQVGFGSMSALESGQTSLSNLHWTPKLGKNTIKFVADIDNMVSESLENNNITELEIEIISVPDGKGGTTRGLYMNSLKGGFNDVKCASENGTCNLTGLNTVRYGYFTKWNYKYNVSGNISCNNATFGDPISGSTKSCYYSPSPTISTKTVTENWTGSYCILPLTGASCSNLGGTQIGVGSSYCQVLAANVPAKNNLTGTTTTGNLSAPPTYILRCTNYGNSVEKLIDITVGGKSNAPKVPTPASFNTEKIGGLTSNPEECGLSLSWDPVTGTDIKYNVYKDGNKLSMISGMSNTTVSYSPGDTLTHEYYVTAYNSILGESASSSIQDVAANTCLQPPCEGPTCSDGSSDTNCSITQLNSCGNYYVNKPVKLEMINVDSGASITWTIKEGTKTTTLTGNSKNKIFTTLGMKIISASAIKDDVTKSCGETSIKVKLGTTTSSEI